MTRTARFALVLCLAPLATAPAALSPAAAGDIQGDAYDCRDLWTMRNQLFKKNGYCFQTAKAIAQFGNEGCRYHSMSAVPLSAEDRLILRDIKRSQARQHC